MNYILPTPEKIPARKHLLVLLLSATSAVGIPWLTDTLGLTMAHGIVHHHYTDNTCGFTPDGFRFFGHELPYEFRYVWPALIFFLVFIISRLIFIHKVLRKSA